MNQANPVRTDLAHLRTEARNPRTLHIDTLPTPDMVRLMCEENRVVEDAVAAQADAIAAAIDIIAARLDAGGHLIYIGAGTSGRLGVVDASECPPTFGVDDRLVRAVIAGGHEAMFHAIEGAEDSAERGAAELEADGVGAGDVVVGLSASGGAPYVLGALRRARELGAIPMGITCNPESRMHPLCDVIMAPYVGPEVITGSTRMKSGTAQKMILNMLSTGVMVKLGKVYGNLMVDVKASNEKLRERCVRIVRQATGAEDAAARAALIETNYACKTAIVMLLLGVDKTGAETLLTRAAFSR